MNFSHFQFLLKKALPGDGDSAKALPEPESLPPLVLAYVGDAFFNLYVRTALLHYEQSKVRILHTYGSQMVSAAMQAVAFRALESALTETEANVVRRGRNAKSTPTKNASASDYRYSTGFEALLGYLYLSDRQERLLELTGQAFAVISREITDKYAKFGEEK
jgi:ribonuclease III family protein